MSNKASLYNNMLTPPVDEVCTDDCDCGCEVLGEAEVEEVEDNVQRM